jgi:hypothetical protein
MEWSQVICIGWQKHVGLPPSPLDYFKNVYQNINVMQNIVLLMHKVNGKSFEINRFKKKYERITLCTVDSTLRDATTPYTGRCR